MRGSRGDVSHVEAGIPTVACLPTLPQVQALQKAVCPDEGVSRSPPGQPQAGPPSPHHHPSCHRAQPAPTSKPASPLLGTASGPVSATSGPGTCTIRPVLLPAEAVFVLWSFQVCPGWEELGGAGKAEGTSHRGIAAVLIFF